MIEAKVICDSISPEGYRLTTFQLRYPKFIHGEFMTHRVFSRNASSSRAIPTKKLLEEVRDPELRAKPVFWGKNQPGMQAAEGLVGDERKQAEQLWSAAAICAAAIAEDLSIKGVHKQIVNRILEPFSHINVVCTATEWANFFGLRLHKDAQPEMRHLAMLMYNAYRESKPRALRHGLWHLPYVDAEMLENLVAGLDEKSAPHNLMELIKVSVARCARVSYMSFETGKKSTVEEDLALYTKLGLPDPNEPYNSNTNPLHASPAEHQATPDIWSQDGYWSSPGQHGNFVGWVQYRKMLPGENVAPIPDSYLPL